MAKLKWGNAGSKRFETGVEQGVLCLKSGSETTGQAYADCVAWNGLTGVTESPSGAEPTDLYADDSKYITLMSAETFGATIEAYYHPKKFNECLGMEEIVNGVTIGQQSRTGFGFHYKTKIGNDEKGDSFGYKIHLVWGCMASPSEQAYQTINDNPDAASFSWEVSTTPVTLDSGKKTASMVIDSTEFTSDEAKAALAALEAVLYGTDGVGSTGGTTPYMPTPDKVLELLGYTTPAEPGSN